jgi:hypothetical protein
MLRAMNGRCRRNIAVRERSSEGPRYTLLLPFGAELDQRTGGGVL